MMTDHLSSYDHQISNGNLENGEEIDEQNNSAKLFERSRIKALAEEREAVQKKTFMKWVNSHLSRVGCKISDLYVDLRDGKMLIKLLEVLSGEKLPNPTKGKMRIHCLENVDKSLTFLNEQKVHLENMGAHDIVDGNPRLTLGLIWTIILRFQIQDITVEQGDNADVKSAKDALLLWCQMKTAGYENINVRNFTTSWRDGLAFNAIIHKHRPDLIDYKSLIKSNAMHNLNNAFETAEDKLGLPKLLDPEDVNIDFPDERSIMTYVVTYYHYFSKMKAESVQGRRVGRVINQCRHVDKDIHQYETLASDLLIWIQTKITELKNHKFANSLSGVQEQLASFNTYRTAEKPNKFQEKGDLEIKLFQIQSMMRANNQKAYTPKEGTVVGDINRAWEHLEKAEHEREIALREELIRQEKLEMLAARCERKAAIKEAWLIENQRLVSQDNFGYDLATVEAATKKHEAIETDINAYEERVIAVVAVARELEAENYHDIERINLRKDNVLHLWQDLLELLRSRRLRLDSSFQLQKTFQEMIYILDWIDEIKMRMQNEDLGKHLAGVEDLKQKHALLDSDIAIIKNRIGTISLDASKFIDGDFEAGEDGYRPCDPRLVESRIDELNTAYEDLLRLASNRWTKLDQSEKMWQFDWEVANEEAWIREKEKILNTLDEGKDLNNTQLLINKQKAYEDEIQLRRKHQLELLLQGRELIGVGNVLAENIKKRMNDLEKQMNDLDKLSELRRKKLLDNLAYHQLFCDADDVDGWMKEMLNLVSSSDVGKDEAGVLSLIKKHQKLTDELENYNDVIKALQNQSNQLPIELRETPEVLDRLSTTAQRYNDLKQLAELKKRRLLDALDLYKLSNEADGVEQWIVEKEKLMHTMVTTEDVEEVEVLKARYDTLENEVQSNADRVVLVNQLAQKLLTSEHPDAEAVIMKQKHMNEKWSDMRRLADKKKDIIDTAHDVNKFHAEAQETMTWIADKEKLIESTDELGNDLSGMIALQRRLSGLNRDLGVIESKINYLNDEGNRLKEVKPGDAPAIKQQLNKLTEIWLELKKMLKARDERLGEVSELQKFLTDLDHFQQWLSRTQTSILSEDIPNNVAEADDFLEQHASVKKEIDDYAPQYQQMKKYGDSLVAGQDNDSQFMFLRERLKALNNDWNDLKKMWDSKQNLLMQSKNLQEFMKEMNHVELLLSQEDNFLSKDEIPQTIEQGEDLLYKHNTFATTLLAHREKIRHALQLGNQLIKDGNYLAPKVQQKINLAEQRFSENEDRAKDQLERVKDHIEAIKLFQDCDELSDWISEKLLTVQDETYRDARNEHSKWLRHQALELELKSNKERLDAIVKHAKQLEQERPDLIKIIDPRINKLIEEWKNLKDQTRVKGERLFNANKHVIYEKNVDDIDGWIDEIESQIVVDEIQPDSYIPFNIIIKKQNLLESQLKIKEHQVQELESQSAVLDELEPQEKDKIMQKRYNVQQKFNALLQPLLERRKKLDESFRARQFELNAAEELMWIKERLPIAKSSDGGKNLQAVLTNRRKFITLNQEITSHQPRFQSIVDQGTELINLKHPNSVKYTLLIEEMKKNWSELKEAMRNRDGLLQQTEKLQQYLHDAGEAEAWLGEQELYLLTNDRPKDEQATTNMLNKQANKERTLEDFTDDIDQLAERAKQLSADKNLDGQAIIKKQERVNAKFDALKDLASQQRQRLHDMLKLYKLHYEIDDLEQWIAEKEVVASSHDFGHDYEHVCELRKIFNEFTRETESIGTDRVSAVNDICDQLIDSGHSEAPTIAEWKDGINEAWSDLLELIETRNLALNASYERFKFFNDCDDVLERIHEKKLLMPGEDMSNESTSSILLQRRLNNFEHDLVLLGTQVQGVQDSAAKLIVSYSGDKAIAIQDAENKVVEAWKNLHGNLETKRSSMNDIFDAQRFFSMARDLEMWMNDVERQMVGGEKPRDVAGVELLISNHKSLKAEIDSREENGTICANLGKDLYKRRHVASAKIKERLIQLAQQRGTLSDHWQDRNDYLQIIWEVYQFARDSTLAESWISTHEPNVQSSNYGATIDAVENLIKKHDALEKTMVTQEERFEALKNLTTLEILEREKRERPDDPPRKLSMVPFFMKEWVPEEQEKPKPKPEVQPPPRPPASPKIVESPDVIGEMIKPIIGMAGELNERSTKITTSESMRTPVTKDPISPKTPEKSNTLKLGRSSSAGKDKKPQIPVSRSVEDDAPVIYEGYLNRKHIWETMIKKSSNRSWEKVYLTVNQARKLSFYKDAKHSKGESRSYLHNETPIDLDAEAAIAVVAKDYVKRQNVFCLKLKEGAEYLLQCKDEMEMNSWIRQIGSGNDAQSHFQTLPSNLDIKRDEPKKKKVPTATLR